MIWFALMMLGLLVFLVLWAIAAVAYRLEHGDWVGNDIRNGINRGVPK